MSLARLTCSSVSFNLFPAALSGIMCAKRVLGLMLGANAVWCCRFWRQVPGHLRCVESNSLGLVWGIGWDGTAWVYSGRSGQQPSQGNTCPIDSYP